ncbi:glycosyltransferase [Microbacterium hydrocarbonoxydans]|uniref:glycosyltransferase n=1 Tax=Microbacterium hydrocarbonoxydans TaxID=273678 RepID=UPI0013DBAF9A|nr:glycosyltransferase [Microbacterium hydrocarbonoxydans]
MTGSFFRRNAGRLLSALPEGVQMRVNKAKYGFEPSDVPAAVRVPEGEKRLYIAPVNFAGQGYRWARAAEMLPGVGAVSMQYRNPVGDFGFPADYALPTAIFLRSRRWQRAQFDAVSQGFTHVLIEAVRPIFGGLFDGDLRREVRALRDAGVTVGLIAHGTDVRVPGEHRADNPFSPFHGDEWDQTPILERSARERRDLAHELALPTFYSTATLARHLPPATWLPVVIDPEPWVQGVPALSRRIPVVVHAPSSGIVKGTASVRAAAERLADEGLIEYREAHSVPAHEMPELYRSADIVVDALRMGNYGVAAVEAMAAGRVVVTYLTDLARREAEEASAVPPCVVADPTTVEQVLRDICAHPDRYRPLAAQGPEFARRVHDGRRSALALAGFLGVDAPWSEEEL